MTSASDETTEDSVQHGVFPNLAHCDLLCFLSVAQKLGSTFLEYTPKYNQDAIRTGGNALVELIYIDSNRPRLQFAFKRIDTGTGLDKEAKYRKLICELAVYDHALLKKHQNITNLTGITWSAASNSKLRRSGVPPIWPVLGFHPSQHGHLGDLFGSMEKQDLCLTQRFHICLDIGHGLEALHALNIIHGDLKPENVVVFNEHGRLVAKLIDFDCSSLGLADDTLVSVVGTPGWMAPECARRNAHFCLGDARKSDIYTYAKLCAWIIFGPVAEIKKFIANPGRVYDPTYETFDILGALQALEQNLLDDGNEDPSLHPTSLESAYTSLHQFFNNCFVGNPEVREDSVSKAAALLEKAVSEIQGSSSQVEWRRNQDLSRDTLGNQSGRNALSVGRYLRSLRASCLGADAEPLTFLDKQRLLLWRQTSWRYITDNFLRPLHIFLSVAFMLSIVACDIIVFRDKYYLEVAQGEHPGASILDMLPFAIGPVLSIVLLPGIIFSPLLYFLRRPTYNAMFQNEDDLFEEEEPYTSTNSGDFAMIQRSNSVLLSHSNGSHVLPEMSCLFPLLNRLHYQARIEVVNELLERKKCPVCRLSAESTLSQLTTMAFGSLKGTPESDIGALSSNIGPMSVRPFERWDDIYEATLPDLPRGIISSLQDDRLDQYSFQELPQAILTIFGEIDGKVRRGYPLRSTQILYIALSRLCSLIGRYEEAEVCCRNALRHIIPRNWRAPQGLTWRMGEAMSNVERKWEHRRDVKRRQLQELEQNLFKFSLVDILEIQGRTNDAIDILRAIPCIHNGPNGYYYEKEPGHVWHRETRFNDARNLLIKLLIAEDFLDVVKRMDQHWDLEDALKRYERWDNNVTDCLENTTKMATAYYNKGRYNEASQLQKERLRLSLEHFKGDRGRIHQAKRDLALSLSHSGDRRRILQAKKFQDRLMRDTEDSDFHISQIRLNMAFTIIQLGDTAEGLSQIQEVIRSARITSVNQDHELFLLTAHLCSSSMYALESQRLIQSAFLELCMIAPSEELTIRLVSLLCTRMTDSPTIDAANDLKDVLKLCLDHELTSQAWPKRAMFLDRLLWSMCQDGWSKRNTDLLNEAIGLADVALNEAVITDLTSGDISGVYRVVSAVYTKKALFLYRNQGFGVQDIKFLNEALQNQRRVAKRLSRDDRDFCTIQRDLASLLTEQGASFHDTACISEAIEIYEDLLRNEQKKKASDSDKLTYSHIRAELCRAQKIVGGFQYGDAAEDNVDQMLAILKEVKEQLEDASKYSILTERLLAETFEIQGQIETARELRSTLFATTSKLYGKDHVETLSAEKELLLFRNRHSAHHYEYLAAFSRLRYTALRSFGPTHASSIEYLSCYADAMHADPMAIDEAINLKRNVLSQYEKLFGQAHTRTIDSSSQLAWMLCQRGGCDYTEGMEIYHHCLASAVTLFGVENPQTLKIWEVILSQKLAQPEKDLDRLTQKLADALRDFLPEDAGLLVSHGLLPDQNLIRLATNAVITTQILGGSHIFATKQMDRFKADISTYGLPEQDLGRVRICVQDLISNEIPDFSCPPAKELGMQWMIIREELYVLRDRDDKNS